MLIELLNNMDLSKKIKYNTTTINTNRLNMIGGTTNAKRWIFLRGTYPKKYKVKFIDDDGKERSISFGDVRYQQYKDSTPLKLYSHLNHLDEKRKNNYYARFGKDAKKYTAKWFSHKYLW